MSRKSEKWANELASKAESDKLNIEIVEETPVDTIAAAEADYVAMMSDPTRVPEYAKPASHGAYMNPDAVVALTRLKQEEADALKKLNESQEAQRAILNAQLAEQAAAEQRIEAAKALPNRLKESLTKVQTF